MSSLAFVLQHAQIVATGFKLGRAAEPVAGVFDFDRVHGHVLVLLGYTVVEARYLSEGRATSSKVRA